MLGIFIRITLRHTYPHSFRGNPRCSWDLKCPQPRPHVLPFQRSSHRPLIRRGLRPVHRSAQCPLESPALVGIILIILATLIPPTICIAIIVAIATWKSRTDGLAAVEMSTETMLSPLWAATKAVFPESAIPRSGSMMVGWDVPPYTNSP